MKYIDMNYELETNIMVEIFDKNYKFKILKKALMCIKNKKIRVYILDIIKKYNRASKYLLIPMKETICNNQDFLYQFWLQCYIEALQIRIFKEESNLNFNLIKTNVFNLYKDKYVENLKNDILEYWN